MHIAPRIVQQSLLLCVALFVTVAATESVCRAVEVETADDIQFFTLKNEKGMTVRVTNFGAIITSIVIPA